MEFQFNIAIIDRACHSIPHHGVPSGTLAWCVWEQLREKGVLERAKAGSDWHCANFFLNLTRIDHDDRIPGATVEEASIWSLAGAFLAADAKDRIHLDSPEGRVVFVWNPEHAVFDRAVFDAGGRPGTTRTTFGDDG